MFRAHWIYLSVILIGAAGCSGGEEGAAPGTPVPSSQTDEVAAESWRESHALEGRETYEAACASCHDTGEGDAPVTGKQGDWSERSGLWVAVLSEHASAGYLDMPEKGGHGELTDEAVAAAVEYMMMRTFPEKPGD